MGARIGKGFTGRPGRTVVLSSGLVQTSDISYLGCYRVAGTNTLGSYGGMAGRTVGGRDRLFLFMVKNYFAARGTVSAATSASAFTVNVVDAGGSGTLAVGDRIMIYHATGTEVAQSTVIQTRSGNDVTVDPPLSATPTVGDVWGRADDPIMEVEIPLADPGATYASAPTAQIAAYWLDPYRGRRVTFTETAGVWKYDTTLNAPNQFFPATLYWHEDYQLLYWLYYGSYSVTTPPDWGLGASALGAPSVFGGGDGTVTAYGPWRTTHVDRLGTTWYGTNRMGWITKKPLTNDLIGGGINKSGIHSNVWGPTMWGRSAGFPTVDTPGGREAADLAANERYLEYYYPIPLGAFDASVDGTQHINKDGSFTGVLTTYQHTHPAGYADVFEADYDTPRGHVDPAQNGGIASWHGATDAVTSGLWFNDGSKQAVIYSAVLAIHLNQNPLSASASHSFYRNSHEYSLHLTNITGTFTTGETVTGLTSGSTLNAGNLTYTASLSKVQGGHTPADVQNWVVGEVVKGNSSLAEGAITVAHRHNVCGHGFERIVTGDFSTRSIPALMFFDPARLETNKAGLTLDYTTPAYGVLDLEAAFNIRTSSADGGTYRNFAGFYFNPTSRRLYCISLAADPVISEEQATTLIHVFHIAA